MPEYARPHDPIRYAIGEVHATYGQWVSVEAKSKSLLKFGRNSTLGTSAETVWTQGGNETYVTTNAIDKISSSSGSDTGGLAYVEGHTVSGTGADAQYTFVAQTVTLTGTTKATLGTPLARVSRVYNVSATTWVGDIYVYEDDDTGTPGVPDTGSKIHMKVVAGDNQSYKAATTFSTSDYFFCTGGWAAVDKKTTAVVDFEMQIRRPGGLFLPVAKIEASSTGLNTAFVRFDPYVIVPRNCDVRITATASTTNVEVNAAFQGYLAVVVG